MVAEELQIKELAGTDKPNSDIEKELKSNKNAKPKKKSKSPSDIPFTKRSEPAKPSPDVENVWKNDDNIKPS